MELAASHIREKNVPASMPFLRSPGFAGHNHLEIAMSRFPVHRYPILVHLQGIHFAVKIRDACLSSTRYLDLQNMQDPSYPFSLKYPFFGDKGNIWVQI